jgi:hypothetical protein
MPHSVNLSIALLKFLSGSLWIGLPLVQLRMEHVVRGRARVALLLLKTDAVNKKGQPFYSFVHKVIRDVRGAFAEDPIASRRARSTARCHLLQI